MQPLYFLENVSREQIVSGNTLNRSLLVSRGLGLVFDDVKPEQMALANLTGNGPTGKPGCVIAYQTLSGAVPDRLGYYPDEIDWHPCTNPTVQIGIRKGSPPTEAELRRPRVFTGYQIPIGGESYDIAVIRRPNDSTELPCTMRLDAAGNLVETIKDQYKELWQASAETVKWFTVQDGFNDFNKIKALRLSVSVLSLNYRFGMDEQNAIGLIDTENFATILSCSIDFPAIVSLQDAKKKNE